jgi:cyclopropane fatty-acyl-phospholipid synthase-like methyltransferase
VEHIQRYVVVRQLAIDRAVLDIDCGEGYGIAILAKNVSHAIGVDVPQETLTLLGKRDIRPSIEFNRGSFVGPAFSAGSPCSRL